MEGTVKGWLEDFFWRMCDPKPILGMTGTYFFKQRTLKVNCLARLMVNQDIRQAASPGGVEIQPCPFEQGFCVGSGHGISWNEHIPLHTKGPYILQGGKLKACHLAEFVCCQDQRFLPLLHRCVMAVASPVVVLLVDLQLRQQSIPLSFEVPCFAAPTKETERERERSWMILDEQLDEF